jgi:superfamily II DNA/RNA helicase
VYLLRGRNLKQVLVFSNTKIGASRLSRQLEQDGIKAAAIHGDKTQAERIAALEAFKNGSIDVLVATDVAARGLDIAELPCVINYDLPYNAEDYVHRIGRTGRAGASGDAISLYSDKDERLLADIEKLIKHKFVPTQLAGFVPQPSRGNGGGERRRREEVDTRAGRSSYAPRKEKIDPWFLQPYEPSVSVAPPTTPQPAGGKSSSIKSKVKVAALLGGLPKR